MNLLSAVCRAQVHKTFKDPVDSTELIPYNLSPLSVVMEQVTLHQCL